MSLWEAVLTQDGTVIVSAMVGLLVLIFVYGLLAAEDRPGEWKPSGGSGLSHGTYSEFRQSPTQSDPPLSKPETWI